MSEGESGPSLALVRTDLANERTLLAYIRTSLMFFGTGVTLVKFLDLSPPLQLAGWVIGSLSLVIGTAGVIRFTRLKKSLNQRKDQP